MKKRLVAMVLGLCILMIVFSSIKINYAFNVEPTICYDGQKKEFIYFNMKNRDMFTDLKDLMPGDRKEQEVTLKAQNITTNTKFFIYMNNDNDESILEYIKIYANDKELVKSKEYIELANFTNDDELRLKVIVEIPKEAGNELEDLEYNMEWHILVQEDGEIIDVPITSDNSHIVLYSIIFIVSIVLMIYTIIKLWITKKENKEKE